MTESGEETRWWWLTQAHKIPMTAALTRVFYPGWAGPGRGRGRGRTARQQPWSSLTRWRWIDLGVRFQVRIKYRMPSFCIHFCAQYLKGKFCAGNFSMVESQAAKMMMTETRLLARCPRPWPPRGSWSWRPSALMTASSTGSRGEEWRLGAAVMWLLTTSERSEGVRKYFENIYWRYWHTFTTKDHSMMMLSPRG